MCTLRTLSSPPLFPQVSLPFSLGATSGIGEITLKTFAKYPRPPRAYFIGRSQDAAHRIVTECKALNPAGVYIFKKADLSLLRVVDEVCKETKGKEKVLNLLFLSAGLPSMDGNGMIHYGFKSNVKSNVKTNTKVQNT